MKKQETNNKKIFGIIAVLAICLVLLVGGLMAYLTDYKTVDNKFTIGSVKINLVEANWDTTDENDNGVPDVAELVVANKVIPKDPKIENTGNNPAYVYLKVTVPTATVTNGDTTTANTQLFTYTVNNTHWTELRKGYSGTNNVYVYYYDTALNSGSTGNVTDTLFDTVTFADMTTTNGITANQTIKVEAYAIQSNGLPTGSSVTSNDMVTNITNGLSGSILTPTVVTGE